MHGLLTARLFEAIRKNSDLGADIPEGPGMSMSGNKIFIADVQGIELEVAEQINALAGELGILDSVTQTFAGDCIVVEVR